MSSPFSFNYKEIDNSDVIEMGSAFEEIPPGRYLAIISDSIIKDTQSGGEMLSLTFEIMQGEHKNRKIWHNFNIKHEKPDTVKRANGELKALCAAIDVIIKVRTSELHDKILCIEIKHKKDSFSKSGKRAAIVGFHPESEYKPEDVTGGSPF